MPTARSRDSLTAILIASGLGAFGLGALLARDWPSQLGLVLLGCALGLPAWQDLRAHQETSRVRTPEESAPRRLWSLGTIAVRMALGWGLAFAGAAALFLGWSGLRGGLSMHPGFMFLPAGLVLAGMGLGRLLGLDQPPVRGWEAVLGLPLRLAGLPALLLGIALALVGAAQILAPSWIAGWIGLGAPRGG